MSVNIILTITPLGAAAVALTQAHREQQASNSSAGTGKSRRLKHVWVIPGTRSEMEIVRTEADPAVKGSAAVYECNADPADYLIGMNAFSSTSQVFKVTPLQLALFKASLKVQLPNLPDSVLDAITCANCSLESLTIPFYFEFENETGAYRAIQDWQQHLKIVFDSADQMPTRSKGWRKSPPRVNSDPDCRNAFIASLPWGQARFSLNRDFGSYPSTFGNADTVSVEERRALWAKTRCLLCIEIKVDLRKFYFTDSSNIDLQLPRDYRLWNTDKMPEDPVKAVWQRFRWETWLEANLLTEADLTADAANDEKTGMNWQLQEVEKAYLDGENVQRHQHIDNDPKKFVQYREALIAQAHIDILNPWAINKLNLAKVLSPNFTYEARFQPQKLPEFGLHTLSNMTIDAAILKLDSAMQGRPGWTFDCSPYEAV
jgi:hypothetical protein